MVLNTTLGLHILTGAVVEEGQRGQLPPPNKIGTMMTECVLLLLLLTT